MKKIVLIFIIGIANFSVYAQNSFIAEYDVISNFHFKGEVFERDHHEATLKYSDGKSQFISPAHNDIIKFKNYRFEFSDRHKEYFYNFYKNDLLQVSTYKGKKIHSEGFPEMSWDIDSEQMIMGDYKVQKATTYLLDEEKKDSTKVTAWFTQDIPVPTGPTFFVNLPGLVIKIKYHSKSESIYLLKKIDFKPVSIDEYNKKNSIEITPHQFIYTNLIPTNKLR